MKPDAQPATGPSNLDSILTDFDFRLLFGLNRDAKILCPFHEETTASFLVGARRGQCFGCGWHGDILDYLEQSEGLSKAEAIKKLEQSNFHTTLPVDNSTA